MTDTLHDDDPGIEVIGAAFAILPESVLYASISDRAVRLYAVLQRHVGLRDGAVPGRKRLAKLLGGGRPCSLSTLDRAIKELRDAHLLRVEHRYRPGTRERTSSRFHLLGGVVTPDDTSRHPRRQVSSPVTTKREQPRESDRGFGRSTRSRARRPSVGEPVAADVMKARFEQAKKDLRG